MGKKTKIGKARRDKFYQLAKETGYRARSAFKLIQLNRKYEFLQNSRACIDLCAAPGGWLQVAQKYMPVSSVIIGVDLVPIKPIGNVITLQEDITTEKCRLAIKKSLQNWKADIVLNDGAPNVGKNWLHDAFNQNQLTLSALKLATEFLSKGGNFITKVFRSKDYQSLIWLFQQLFRKVHATKPQASRHESAEIFVFCERFLAPDHIDPKFFDTKYVFQEIDSEPSSKLNIMHPEKQKKRAEGYAEGKTLLFEKVSAMEFIKGSNHIEVIEQANELVLNDVLKNHSLTTDEIKECCSDIKVLGRREIRLLLTWRKKLKEIFEKSDVKAADIENMDTAEKKENDVDSEVEEEERVQKEIENIQNEEAVEAKRKKRKILKERRKLRDKMNLKMMLPNDEPIVQQEDNLFKLSQITSKNQLKKVDEGDISFMDDDYEISDHEVDVKIGKKTSNISRNRHIIDSDGEYSDLSDDDDDKVVLNSKKKFTKADNEDVSDSESKEDLTPPTSEDEECEDDVDENNPLLVDVEKEEKINKRNKNIDLWFKKDVFQDLENDEDEDLDFEILMQNKDNSKKKASETINSSDDDSGNASDYDINSAMNNVKSTKAGGKKIRKNVDDDDLEIVPQQDITQSTKKKKNLQLDPEGLALGAMMIKSQKVKRDIIDSSYNKYTYNDTNLPAWFVDDETKHNKKPLPVSKEMVSEYKEKLKEINARPIKKVAEAKARKKKRAARKMERARKKAESITETADMTDKEKAQQIKQIYNQALRGKKKKKGAKEVSYVVAKKGVGKRVQRPAGVSGRFKVVDPRLKKDSRKRKATEKKNGKKGNKRQRR